jgi:hypothetical protein
MAPNELDLAESLALAASWGSVGFVETRMENTMFEPINDGQQYESFDLLLKDVKQRYRRIHQGEIEGLDYECIICRLPDGKFRIHQS